MRLLNRLRRPDRFAESGQLPLELVRIHPQTCSPLDLPLIGARHLVQRDLLGDDKLNREIRRRLSPSRADPQQHQTGRSDRRA
jgi:hypothetical protein